MREIPVINIPIDKSILYRNKKVVYFADPMLTMRFETQEEECQMVIEAPLQVLGICFNSIDCTTTPPFGKMTYDVLFFDYGGMSIGNGSMRSFCRQIILEANDFPSRYYVMVSSFTEQAMKEAFEEFGESANQNIFLDMEVFAKTFIENE